MTKLTTLEVISVKPCEVSNGCYIVKLFTNVFGEYTKHVQADNPYHAVNRYIKQLAEDYGFVRWGLNNNLGVVYREGYDAGWTYKGTDDYRYTAPAVVEEVPVEPVNEVAPEPSQSMLYLTNFNKNEHDYSVFWVEMSKDGTVSMCPGHPSSSGMTVFDANTVEEALAKVFKMFGETHTIIDVSRVNFFGLAKKLFTSNLRVELNVSRNGETLLSKTEYIN